MNHFMIDCETLSTRVDAAVISIGCQQFSIETGKMGGTFYQEIDFESAVKAGHVSGATVQWWMQQSAKAQRVFTGSDDDKKSTANALVHLIDFIRGCKVTPFIWANGAADDIAWLRWAFVKGAVGLSEPWNFRNVRDMRTLMDLAEVDTELLTLDKIVEHNALADATWQAQAVSIAYRKIKNALKVSSQLEDDEL
jgi:hypothetical protein